MTHAHVSERSQEAERTPHSPGSTGSASSNSLRAYLERKRPAKVKLHLGCGGERWQDFINVDLYPSVEGQEDTSRDGCIAEAWADMRNLGLDENTIDEIFTSHTLEHFVRWEAVEMLRHWHRLLKPGGVLAIETPDLLRVILNVFHPRRSRRKLAWNMFYGNQWNKIDYETHRYVWTASEITKELLSMGFSKVAVTHRTLTHIPGRDMRITATK